MLSYSSKHRKNTESKNPKVVRIKNRRIKCAVCEKSKKSKFIKEQECSGLLSGLGINTSLNKIPLLGPVML